MVDSLRNPNLGILLVRVALGIVFVAAGVFKIGHMDAAVSGFVDAGISGQLAYVVAYVELIGGVLLALGIFVRSAGLALALVMLVAVVKVHWAMGFSAANGGYEYPLTLMLAALAAAASGAGTYSLANWLGWLPAKKEAPVAVL